MCFVIASLTAMIGKPSFPSASSALSRITPVVVSSVPAMISPVRPFDPALALLREGEVFHVVALRCCHEVLSRLCGPQQPLVLALLPLHPAELLLGVGQPAVDRGPQLRLPPQPRGEGDVADPE